MRSPNGKETSFEKTEFKYSDKQSNSVNLTVFYDDNGLPNKYLFSVLDKNGQKISLSQFDQAKELTYTYNEAIEVRCYAKDGSIITDYYPELYGGYFRLQNYIKLISNKEDKFKQFDDAIKSNNIDQVLNCVSDYINYHASQFSSSK